MLYRTLGPRSTLLALNHSTFRWWLVERTAAAATWAMRGVARGWLVYSLTGSVLALAWVEAVRAAVGVIVSPLAGVISDRIEKRLVMFGCRMALVLTNLLLALMIFLGVLQVWHIIAVTVLEAVVYSVMEPALQTIVPELVDREVLLSATSTTFVVEGVFNIIGAAAGGLIIEAAGAGWVFLINVPLFGLAAYALWHMPKRIVTGNSNNSLRSDLAAGIRYLRARTVLLVLVALAFARLLFIQPYASFLPAFSRSLGFDAAGLGLLTSAAGTGALLSSILIAALGDPPYKGRLLLASGAAAAASVTLLMMTGSLAPFILVVLAGIFANAADVFTRTLMQLTCEASYRGRVSGVAMVLGNMVMLSVIPAGVLADVYGVPLIVGGLATLVFLAYIIAAALLPDIRNLK